MKNFRCLIFIHWSSWVLDSLHIFIYISSNDVTTTNECVITIAMYMVTILLLKNYLQLTHSVASCFVKTLLSMTWKKHTLKKSIWIKRITITQSMVETWYVAFRVVTDKLNIHHDFEHYMSLKHFVRRMKLINTSSIRKDGFMCAFNSFRIYQLLLLKYTAKIGWSLL